MGIILAAGKGSRMKSDLPKVLHKVNGKPMVSHSIETLKKAGADEIVVVVGYKSELIERELGDSVHYAYQTQQLGTGHAVMAAEDFIEHYKGNVVVVYGDNPLLQSVTVKKLVDAVEGDVEASLLTMTLENPPEAGRIIRDENNNFVNIVETQNCSKEQLLIPEINCGAYCFKPDSLLSSLKKLKPNNNQGEYYLTDAPVYIAQEGKKVETVQATEIFEILGVNDQKHRQFAEFAKDIAFAEKLYPLVDKKAKEMKEDKRFSDLEKFRNICSHDLRAELSRIIMLIDCFDDEEIGGVKEEIQMIHDCAKGALKLIDENIPSRFDEEKK